MLAELYCFVAAVALRVHFKIPSIFKSYLLEVFYTLCAIYFLFCYISKATTIIVVPT